MQRLIRWARVTYCAALLVGLLGLVPSAWFPLQLGKITIAAVFFFASAVLFALGGGGRLLARRRWLIPMAAAALLGVAYLLSYAFSIDPSIGLTGFSIEADTVLFVFFGLLAFGLGMALFQDLGGARLVLGSVLLAAVVAGLFQCLVLLGGSYLPSLFADHSVNLIGKWNDLGLLVGLVYILSISSLGLRVQSRGHLMLLYVSALVSLMLLAIINFPLLWMLGIGFSLVIALWSFLSRRAQEGAGYRALIPWVPLVSVFVCSLFLLWGAAVNARLTHEDGLFPVSSLEVRPSYSSTEAVMQAAHGSLTERFLLGTGPQTFGEVWLAYKPSSVNQSAFWSFDFNVGVSSFMTALSSVGILGALAWLIPLLLVLASLGYALRSSRFAGYDRTDLLLLALAAIYLWCGMLFYVPSEMLLVAAFALSGALVGVVFGSAISEDRGGKFNYIFGIFLAILVMLWAGVAAGVLLRRAISESYVNQAQLALAAGRADQAVALAAKARETEATADTLRISTDAGAVKLQQLAGAYKQPTPEQLSQFAAVAKETIGFGQQAIAKRPADYRAYLSLARVYDLLNSLGTQEAFESAKTYYTKAEAQSPMDPQIPLALARLSASKNDVAGVNENLKQSLTLKRDYTDAILFLVQLDVAQHDLPNAIRAAQAAVQSAPGVAPIWFELGLLYYSGGDTADAIAPLEQAVKLQPDYANAKYFLGLSYAAQNHIQEAQVQFQDIEKSNPDNTEVKLILSNLEAGKPPFSGATTTLPQERSAAPVTQ